MLTRDEILSRKTGRGTVTLRDGSVLGVRALTRDEAADLNDIDGTVERDNYVIHKGLTDPRLSLEDVQEWGKAGEAGDLVDVSNRIAELSGLKKGADKSGV